MRRTDQIIDAVMKPILKQAGFRKRRHLWSRHRGEFIDAINVQAASYNTSISESFTINVGVLVPEIFEAIWNKTHKDFPNPADCQVELRVGDLITRSDGSSYDLWWRLESQNDAERAGREISEILIETVLPFLDGFETIYDVIDHLEIVKGYRSKIALTKINLALAIGVSGDPSRSIDILQDVAQGSDGAWSKWATELITKTRDTASR